jgi:phosphoribosylglycinamide formyltransferase-1
VADRNCPAVKFAEKYNLESHVVNFEQPGQVDLIEKVQSINPVLIISTVNKILCPGFLRSFNIPVLNLHYSLLPAFAGAIGKRPIEEALKFGSCLLGVTVHHVTEIIDGGEPVVQIAFPVKKNEDLDQVMDIAFRAGCFALAAATFNVLEGSDFVISNGTINISNRIALVNPLVAYPDFMFDDEFWQDLKMPS